MHDTVLLFLLAGHRLALPADAVRECLPLPSLWRRPGLPVSVAGVFSLGGAMLPVLDLARLLGLRDRPFSQHDGGPYRHLLHLGAVALLVDRATGFAPRGETVPDIADAWQHGCVSARLLIDGEPVPLLDPARILLADERARLDALTLEAGRRAEGWRDAG